MVVDFINFDNPNYWGMMMMAKEAMSQTQNQLSFYTCN
jgi:hypothetical protein